MDIDVSISMTRTAVKCRMYTEKVELDLDSMFHEDTARYMSVARYRHRLMIRAKKETWQESKHRKMYCSTDLENPNSAAPDRGGNESEHEKNADRRTEKKGIPQTAITPVG
jgi:catechol-2,3-dioxygenase